MSGSLNTFRVNIDASFDNLDPKQFEALWEEVLKEKARRLIGKEAVNTGMSWKKVGMTADVHVSNGNAHIVASTWDLTHKDRQVDWGGPQILMPEGSAIPASGSIIFGGW